MRLEREVNGVRLISKGGYDWTKRYSRIIDAASKDHQTRLVIDDETIVRGSRSTAGLGCDDLGHQSFALLPVGSRRHVRHNPYFRHGQMTLRRGYRRHYPGY